MEVRMLKHITPWQVSLAAVTGALALAAIYTNVLIEDRQQSLIESSGYNTVFDASQGATEFIRLEAAVGRYALEPSAALLEEVQLRYSIMESRVALLQQGMVRSLIDAQSVSRNALTTLAAVIVRQSRWSMISGAPATPKSSSTCWRRSKNRP